MLGLRFDAAQQDEILLALQASGFMKHIVNIAGEAQRVTNDLFNSDLTPAEASISACASANVVLSEYHITLTTEPQYPIACRCGCWYCCTKPVQCYIHEVFLIAYLVQGWEEAERAELIARLVRYKNEVNGKSIKSIDGKRIPCPLLVDNTCRVYESRPTICGGWTSLDVEACKRAYRSRWSMTVPPSEGILELRALYETTGLVIAETIAKHGLVIGPVNLALALLIALTVDGADDLWTRGEPLFASAMWPGSE